MKQLLYLAITLLLSLKLYSQEYKYDSRPQLLKEYGETLLKSDQISKFDLLQALEMSGITINKYSLGEFNKKHKFLVLLDEFKEGKNIKSDTLINSSNEYTHFERGKEGYFKAYIDQIKIFTQVKDTSFTLRVNTYAMSSSKKINYKKYDKESFYNIRSYVDTKWKLNKKQPLLVYASSWKDKKWGFQRFCGVSELKEDDENSNELLTSSPHYYMISYIIK